MTSTLDERWDLKRAAEVIGTAEKTINSNVQLLTCSKFQEEIAAFHNLIRFYDLQNRARSTFAALFIFLRSSD